MYFLGATCTFAYSHLWKYVLNKSFNCRKENQDRFSFSWTYGVRRDPASHNFTTSFKHHVAQCPLTIKPFRCQHLCACPSSRLNEESSSLQLRSRLRARSDACISCEWCHSWACCKWIFTDIWRSVGVDWNRPVHLSCAMKSWSSTRPLSFSFVKSGIVTSSSTSQAKDTSSNPRCRVWRRWNRRDGTMSGSRSIKPIRSERRPVNFDRIHSTWFLLFMEHESITNCSMRFSSMVTEPMLSQSSKTSVRISNRCNEECRSMFDNRFDKDLISMGSRVSWLSFTFVWIVFRIASMIHSSVPISFRNLSWQHCSTMFGYAGSRSVREVMRLNGICAGRSTAPKPSLSPRRRYRLVWVNSSWSTTAVVDANVEYRFIGSKYSNICIQTSGHKSRIVLRVPMSKVRLRCSPTEVASYLLIHMSQPWLHRCHRLVWLLRTSNDNDPYRMVTKSNSWIEIETKVCSSYLKTTKTFDE